MARVLVADSDACARETVSMCLERWGHEVILAEDGTAAIAAIVRDRPQLVMTEIMLPMRSGFDILDAIKGFELAATVPVIFVTALSTERSMDRALAEGVSDYVVKPFHLHEIVMRANLALARRANNELMRTTMQLSGEAIHSEAAAA